MNVYRFTAFAAVAASVLAMPVSGVQAASRDKLYLTVPKGLCAKEVSDLAAESVTKPAFTVYAAPRVRSAKKLDCDQPGPEVTVAASSSTDLKLARKTALATCNATRGAHGSCFVIGTLRN
ncbi:hypothetical protein [Neptunicoccus cionae]|uniref:hypothetical protein n=1 Tax=Neptunicoccus cionae TaxID=2035344 RepID=UPI000C75DB34|nr:hypothetical protein [Amylibacter cionae]PLS22708.1 hypothetical protein C0U40_00715 [Amylibacter cionae]